MNLTIYMLHKPDDRLDGWFVIYDPGNEKFISWDYLHSIKAKLPEYMRQHLNPDNDYPVIVKRKTNAEKIVSAIHRSPKSRPGTGDVQVSFTETAWLHQIREKAAQ
ncbi:MAG: hypothetical protein SCH70_14480 [Candidatus Methanoperedens sp.]|nr:hypothetical protein [Candidatus Methanoperedens sp.]